MLGYDSKCGAGWALRSGLSYGEAPEQPGSAANRNMARQPLNGPRQERVIKGAITEQARIRAVSRPTSD